MAGGRLGARLLAGMRDPWALLLSTFGGGAVWAFGASIPLSAGTAGVMLATAAVVSALTRSRDESAAPPREGTRQAKLIGVLDENLRLLRSLQTEALPNMLQSSAAEAIAAADLARPSALRVAAAADALDEAIVAARKVSGQGEQAAQSIRDTVGRLRKRKAELLDRLTGAVDEVATVYTGLLELSATARTMGVSLDSTEVTKVNDSVVLLRATFAELEADAEDLRNQGLL